MTELIPITPKKRINSIDALRGFALVGIMLLHSMEHFDLTYTPVLESPFWQAIDTGVFKTLQFLFQGKSYAIFSLLFGLSFFMMMDSQQQKGNDFRVRFLWRMTILLVFGYINGLIYMGEFFIIYAILGIFLVPLYKVPTKWLVALIVLLLLQIPQIIQFVYLLSNNIPNEPTALKVHMDQLFEKSASTFINGSFGDMLKFNAVEGQTAKLLWFVNVYRYVQLIGLFIVGLLIGRSGIYKSEEKMMEYSKKVLPIAFVWFAIFITIEFLLPLFGITDFALEIGQGLFRTYANLGIMMIYICGFTILYYKTTSGQKILDCLAPVGRMSVTNYMMQSLFGVTLFYGFGLNLAVEFTFLQCALVGMSVCAVQILYSNWWMKRFYYGPMEWLWRTLTWFKAVPMKRK